MRQAYLLVAVVLCIAASPSAFGSSAVSRTPQGDSRSSDSRPALKVGDPAPAFSPGTWLKGEPVRSFERKRIYVLEFWATWCGPCKAAIPHITELAARYAGRATFIGVDVMETRKTAAENDEVAAEFLKAQGDAMRYLVCCDAADGAMKRNWLDAAGIEGIPATFIVDGDGKFVWQGHPMRMGPVLEKVVAGVFDPFAEEAAAKAYQAAEGVVHEALQAKEWERALKLAEALKPLDDVARIWKGMFAFQAMLHVDAKAAEKAFTAMLSERPDLAQSYARIILREEGLAQAWYARTIPVLEKLAASEKSALATLSEARFKSGDAKSAVASLEAYLEFFRSDVARILKEHPDAGDMINAELAKVEARLKEYKAAVKD